MNAANPRTPQIKPGWYLFSAVLTFALAFEGLVQYWATEGAGVTLLLATYLAICSAIALSIIYLINRLSPRLGIFCLAAYWAGCLVLLKLLFFDSVLGWSGIYIVALGLVALLVLYRLAVASNLSLRSPGWGWYTAILVILVVAPAATRWMAPDTGIKPTLFSLEEQEVLSKFSEIEFKQRPNIYYLSYDSMVPQYIASKYMDIDRLPYLDQLEANFDELFPSAIMNTPTKPSLNSLMRLEQTNIPASHDFFSGIRPSLLGAIFQANDYELTTGYSSFYLGKPGPWVDRYIVPKDEKLGRTALCITLGERLVTRLRAFAACDVLGEYSTEQGIMSLWADSPPKRSGKRRLSWPATVINEIDEPGPNPTLKILHVYSPVGHVPNGYRDTPEARREESQNYYKRARHLGPTLEKIVQRIRTLDPDSIVIISGDHGVLFSLGIEAEDDAEFVIEDQKVVSTSVLTGAHECGNRHAVSRYSEGFHTPSRVMASIIHCLSEDDRLDDWLQFEAPEDIVSVLKRMGSDQQ